MNSEEFNKRVYCLVKGIPRGKVSTYKEIALALYLPRQARRVGRALRENAYHFFSKNKRADFIPCHRVIMSSGGLGGYKRGKNNKIRLLRQEGLVIRSDKVVQFKNYLVTYKN